MLRTFFCFSIFLSFSLGILKPLSVKAEILTNNSFDSALEHYKSGEYSKALVDWHSLLQEKKYNRSPELLYNLALTEFKLDDYGPALAHLRKAQVINPFSFKIFKTMNVFKKAIAEKEFYHVESESFVKILFSWLPKSIFMILFLIALGSGAIVALRQKASEVTFWQYLRPYLIFVTVSAVPLGLIYIQNQIKSQIYATLVGNSPAVIYTSHNTEAPEIGTLRVGDVFQVLEAEKTSEGWLAVTTSQVPMGWIKADSYIVHRGPDSENFKYTTPLLKIDPKPSTN